MYSYRIKYNLIEAKTGRLMIRTNIVCNTITQGIRAIKATVDGTAVIYRLTGFTTETNARTLITNSAR